jgi:predicted metal-dependent hydrolase
LDFTANKKVYFRVTHSYAARLGTPESSEINLDGKIVPYTLKRSAKTLRARLEIRTETGLTVIVPQSYPSLLVPGIIIDKKRWVTDKLRLFRHIKQDYPSDGHSARYLGRELKVKTRVGHDSDYGAILAGNELILHSKTAGDNRQDIENWLKNQAEIIIKAMAERHSSKIGVKYHALHIRPARTRWGSCSPGGTLSFNWKLIMAPLPVIEYVVVHELCHLRELNHSKSFWKLVELHCPEWRVQRKWLRANEAALTI